MKRKEVTSGSSESVLNYGCAPVLEREAGLRGRQDLGVWCLGVWSSRTVTRAGCSAARALKPEAQ